MNEFFIDISLMEAGEGVILCEAIQVTDKNFDDIVVRFASNAIVGRSIVTPALLHKCKSDIDENNIGKECIVISYDDEICCVVYGWYLVKFIGKIFDGKQKLCDDFYDGYLGYPEDEFKSTFITPEEFYTNLKIAIGSIK